MTSDQQLYISEVLNQQIKVLDQQTAIVLKEPKTSLSHPINISWIIPPDVLTFLSHTDFPPGHDLYDFLNLTIREKYLHLEQQQIGRRKGNLCLSSCPGKKVRLSGPVRGRAAINRDLDLDFERMKTFGITMLVCCLDDTEMDFLGASWPKYEMAARAQGLQIIRLPMIEGGCPQTLNEVREAVSRVNIEIYKGDNVLVHCRGGVGRAGLFAACWMLENLLCRSVERAVYILREQRSPKAIETLAQVKYLLKYSMELNKRLGLTLKKTQTTDLSSDIIPRTSNGAPSIPLIAKLENELLIEPSLIKDQFTPSSGDHPWWST